MKSNSDFDQGRSGTNGEKQMDHKLYFEIRADGICLGYVVRSKKIKESKMT